MKIVCNGTVREIGDAMTLLALIRELGLDPETVVAEVEGCIVPRPSYETVVLAEGNTLELIRFVGGG
jgi:thiamine biosynthesis protein ThiS